MRLARDRGAGPVNVDSVADLFSKGARRDHSESCANHESTCEFAAHVAPLEPARRRVNGCKKEKPQAKNLHAAWGLCHTRRP